MSPVPASASPGQVRSDDQQLSDILIDFAKTMITDFPIQAILDHLVERIVKVLPITGSGVTLISPGVRPRYIVASDDAALRYEQLQTQLNEGPCVLAYQSGQPVSVPDLRDDDRFPSFTPAALKAGLAAVFTFPLKHGEIQLGALDLYRGTPGGLSSKTMDVAQTLADVAAAYLLNAQAREELEDSSHRSREASLHDALTGLPNRILMLERLDQAFQRTLRTGKNSAVMFIDLDHFKAVNDTYGHRVGDELLVAVAQRLRGALRPHDSVSRLSGDEFVVLCEDLDSPSQADHIQQRLIAALSHPFVLTETELAITASIGMAYGLGSETRPEELIHEADMAMYRMKHANRAGPIFSAPRRLRLADHEAALERDLHHSLDRDELLLRYQPIVSAADGRVTGFEALLRWEHPTHGLVAPTTIIPLAEHSNLIDTIGLWVLEQAWANLQRWNLVAGTDQLTMAVNVSAHQLMGANFSSAIADLVASNNTPPGQLTLEVTESIFLRDSERALMVLDDLKSLGVAVALDDFGTGYSALGYLKHFPVDILKIDQTFTADVARNPAGQTIVGAIVALSRGLGMTVVAEGVENFEQLRQLRELGADQCQGFYFARPLPVDQVETMLRRSGGSPSYLPFPRTSDTASTAPAPA